jgi:hypothetical protein
VLKDLKEVLDLKDQLEVLDLQDLLEVQDLKEVLDHKDLLEVQDQKDQQEHLLDHNIYLNPELVLQKQQKDSSNSIMVLMQA